MTAVEWYADQIEQLEIKILQGYISNNQAIAELPNILDGAKAMEKRQQDINEEKLRESLLTLSLVNPVHLKMTSDGRGEFPDGYHLTKKGIDLLVETLKSK